MAEGDVIGVSLPILAAIGASILGGVFALLKWFATRLLADIDMRLKRIDEIETRLDRMAVELPMHYVRREDHIREMTAITAKLDRIYELLIREEKR